MSRPDDAGPPGRRRSAWRRDRLIVVCGLVALVATAFGVLWSLTVPSGSGTADRAVALGELDDLREHVGQRVVADGVEVDSVPADEGFWVQTDGGRVWVQVDTAGESPFEVREGQRVDLTGTVVAHGADFAQQPDFPAADAEDLVEAGAHVEVDVADLDLVG